MKTEGKSNIISAASMSVTVHADKNIETSIRNSKNASSNDFAYLSASILFQPQCSQHYAPAPNEYLEIFLLFILINAITICIGLEFTSHLSLCYMTKLSLMKL